MGRGDGERKGRQRRQRGGGAHGANAKRSRMDGENSRKGRGVGAHEGHQTKGANEKKPKGQRASKTRKWAEGTASTMDASISKRRHERSERHE